MLHCSGRTIIEVCILAWFNRLTKFNVPSTTPPAEPPGTRLFRFRADVSLRESPEESQVESSTTTSTSRHQFMSIGRQNNLPLKKINLTAALMCSTTKKVGHQSEMCSLTISNRWNCRKLSGLCRIKITRNRIRHEPKWNQKQQQ